MSSTLYLGWSKHRETADLRFHRPVLLLVFAAASVFARPVPLDVTRRTATSLGETQGLLGGYSGDQRTAAPALVEPARRACVSGVDGDRGAGRAGPCWSLLPSATTFVSSAHASRTYVPGRVVARMATETDPDEPAVGPQGRYRAPAREQRVARAPDRVRREVVPRRRRPGHAHRRVVEHGVRHLEAGAAGTGRPERPVGVAIGLWSRRVLASETQALRAAS